MKRLTKILKWTGIVMGLLVAIGLIANALFVSTTDTQLERQLAAIRLSGDPLTPADLARPSISPEKNAATYLRRAQEGVAAIDKETMNLKPVSERPGFLMPLEDQKAFKTTLTAYPNVIPLLEQAAACPDYDSELDYTLPSEEFLAKLLTVVSEHRSVARLLRYRAELLVAAGNRDEAVRMALTTFRLASHFDHDPMLIGYLVTMAVRGDANRSAAEALETGPISKGSPRHALDSELGIQERMLGEGFVRALKSERVYMLESFDGIPGRNFWLVSRGVCNTQESASLEVFPAFIALARDPNPYREAARAMEGNRSTMAALLFPSLKASYAAVTRTRALIRSLRVLNALQMNVPAESAETPKLSELGLPAEATTDPFTGEPLHVKKTPQGWLVYSVGANFQDDGGKLLDDGSTDGDIGVGPPPPVAKSGKSNRPGD